MEFGAYQVDLSADGRYVAFTSSERNLPGGSDLVQRVHVRDIRAGRTQVVSVSPSGAPADNGGFSPSISGDGRFVVFSSTTTNLDGAAVGGGFVDVRA